VIASFVMAGLVPAIHVFAPFRALICGPSG
jgi:hypothetical protein